MKRVLVVFTSAFERTGGLTSVMMNYWRVLPKDDYSFDFASSNPIDTSLHYEISKDGSRYYQLPQRKRILSYFIRLRGICQNYDIIHINANSATSVIELLAARSAGVSKRIHHNHTSRTKFPLLNKVLFPFFKCLYTDAVACSDTAGEWLFGKDNYKVLPNAIDVSKYKYDALARNKIRDEFDISDNEFVVGHVGKFMDAKNHEFLIKFFAAYHAKHTNSKLLLVGDGEWRPKVEGWVSESGCSSSIILAGLRSDISSILQAFDVFVFPSIYEGLPLTVLEAQASGLPCVISTNVTDAVNVCENVVMKSLTDGIDSWVTTVDNIDYAVSREYRCDRNCELLTNAHFNIRNEMKELLKIYSITRTFL